MNEKKCTICGNSIKKEYFNAASGEICASCLKQRMVYYALKELGLVEQVVRSDSDVV